MNTKWLRAVMTSPIAWFIITGLAIGIYTWIVETSEIKWAGIVLAIASISIGIGLDSFIRATRIENQMKKINLRLDQIKNSLEEIMEQQDTRTNSSSMIIPTLETFTKLYLDYIDKQKDEGELQDNTSGPENQKE